VDRKTVNRLALKLNRIADGKNQRSLAREINRSQAWLSRVERGDRGSVVTEKDLAGLAVALGLDTSDLEAK
jgi:transcriptional regulator with XRE-family HTH domain